MHRRTHQFLQTVHLGDFALEVFVGLACLALGLQLSDEEMGRQVGRLGGRG